MSSICFWFEGEGGGGGTVSKGRERGGEGEREKHVSTPFTPHQQPRRPDHRQPAHQPH